MVACRAHVQNSDPMAAEMCWVGFPSALSELLLADDIGMVVVGLLAFHGKCSHVPESVMEGSSAPRAGLPAWH